jgi:hypothetical protein
MVFCSWYILDTFRWQILNRNERKVYLPSKVVIRRYYLDRSVCILFIHC